MYRLFRGGNRKNLMKYLLIFFLGIVCFSMVGMFTPIFRGGQGNVNQANVLASINGNQITIQDLQQQINSQLQTAGSDPKAVAQLANSALDQMLMQQALLAQAQKMGLQVSNQELVSALRQNPMFFQNGQFVDMQTYESLVQNYTGMSVPQFEDQMRLSILVKKLRDALTDGVDLSPGEVHDAFVQRNQKALIHYVTFEPTQFLGAVQVNPQALNTYFLARRLKYKMPEQRQAGYVLIPPDAVKSQAAVSDADAQNYYTQHLATYQVQDRVKVSHILFKTTGETPQQQQQTLQLAQKVLAQIKGGTNFADMAKKYSQDPGSAQNGGELGWIQRGQTVKPFEDAAFSMKPGEMSNLIKTIYGYHIIKVEDKQVAHLQPFAEVKSAIQSKLQKQALQQAENALASKVEDALKANPQNLDTVAKQNGLESGQTPLFTYNQAVPDLGNNAAFENLAFQLPLNTPGQPIEVPKGVAIIIVTKIIPEHLPALSEVEQQVEQDYRATQAKVLTGQNAKQFAAQVKRGDFAKAAQADGYKVQKSQNFTQQDQLQDTIPASSVASAFTLKPGQTSRAIAVGTTYIVFQVISHTPADEADFPAQKASLSDQLLQQKRDLAFQIYQDSLKQRLVRSGKLKYNGAAMKSFLSGYQTS